MTNMICLIGRIVNEPISITSEEGKTYVTTTIAVNRSFKNENGEYDTDFIKIKLFGFTGNTTMEYVRKGDLIGVKGRLESNGDRLEVIAEKVTFLSSNRG